MAALVLHPVAMALVAPSGPSFPDRPLFFASAPSRRSGGVRRSGARAGLALRPPAARRGHRAALLGLAWRLPAGAQAYGWGVQNINAMQVRLEQWVASRTPPDALIALNDLGALTYFGASGH